ncbi:MAG: single-stranded DNA-binding protein [Leptospira sp.]|nr:single-stranded DNA-binding protein [Leptospira sp.]
MANDLNKVLLIARLTRDPDYKNINGTSLVNFGVANNRTYVANGEKKEETHYFDCEAWGKLADIIRQYATKGKQVMIEGRLKYDSWDTPDGKKASRIKVFVENLQLLGSPSGGSGGRESSGGYPDQKYDSPSYPSNSGGDSGSQFGEYESQASSDDEPF